MAINDMKNGEGGRYRSAWGFERNITRLVPSHRTNDIAYLDPSDMDNPFHLNPLEVKNPAYRDLIASGIVSIFYKLYHMSWGPRLEYILRNTILTLTHVPQSTFLDIPELLTNDTFREKIVEKLDDRVLKNFWLNEFNRMSPQLRSESISPILNKVGQFLSSKTIRNIVGHPVSTIDSAHMMNEWKIVIVNLSQATLGEDSSALLGAMSITKMQLAAMNRVYKAEESRRDSYLYVDDFQNFATQSFIKILSKPEIPPQLNIGKPIYRSNRRRRTKPPLQCWVDYFVCGGAADAAADGSSGRNMKNRNRGAREFPGGIKLSITTKHRRRFPR